MSYGWAIVSQTPQTVLSAAQGGFEEVMVITFEVRDLDKVGTPLVTTARLEVPQRLYTPDYVESAVDRLADNAWRISRLGKG